MRVYAQEIAEGGIARELRPCRPPSGLQADKAGYLMARVRGLL